VRLLAGFAAAAAFVSPANNGHGASMIEHVSAMLSPIPFGSISPAQLSKLQVEGEPPCKHWADCSYFKDSAVAHSVYDGKIVSKWLTIEGGTNVAPFGIGTDRSQQAVLPRIERHLRRSLSCIELKQDTGAECSADIDTGSITIQFDSLDKITVIHLQDWTAP
jgi:hypothetical protein